MARASGVSLSLRRAGFPVTSPAELDKLDTVSRVFDLHVRVEQCGVYIGGSTQCAVYVIGGVSDQRQQEATELLERIREHLERKYPPTPVLGARNGQTRPRVTAYRARFSNRDRLYVD